MKQALAAGDVATAKTYFGKIEGSVAGLQQKALQAPKAKAADPKQSAWEQERAGYQEKEVLRFQNDVQARNETWMGPKVKTELASYLNGAEKRLSANAFNRLDRAVREEIWNKHLATNSTFMKSREQLYAKQDLDGVERLYKQYADKLFPTIVRQMAKDFGLAPAAKRAAGSPAGAGKDSKAATGKVEQGFTVVDRYPKPEEVDSKATSFDMKMKDQFVLKNGKKVQVKIKK
jgi:hypothetical protein